jgi:hypothetical protein
MARKTTTTTVTGERAYALKKGRVVGTTQKTTSITRSRDLGNAIDTLKLPVFVLLFWLLVLAPFFTVMTKFENGQVLLADKFTLTEPSNGFVRLDYEVNYLLNTFIDTDGSYLSFSSYTSTEPIQIIADSIIIEDPLDVTILIFYENSTMIQYSEPQTGLIISEPVIPSNATHFALVGYKLDFAPWTPHVLVSEQDFIDNKKEYEGFIFQSGIDYYQIMENARTAEYGNPFEFITFILSLPSLIADSRPLAFLGINTTTSEMNDAVQKARSITTIGNFRLTPILNPFRWGQP